MATKKRTSKTKRKNNKPSAAEVQKVEEFRLEILLWALIACSLLLFVSNFGIGGTIGNYVSSFLFGIFGLTAYVFPILLIIACFFMISNRGNFLAIIKLLGGILLIAFLCMFISLIFVSFILKEATLMTPMESFK